MEAGSNEELRVGFFEEEVGAQVPVASGWLDVRDYEQLPGVGLSCAIPTTSVAGSTAQAPAL